MTGVALSTGCDGVRKKKHVHIRCNEWEVTSDVAIVDVPFCKVLDRILPGRLGSYIYPDDAVFTCTDRQRTTYSDLALCIERERTKRNGTHQINHISVVTNETVVLEDGIDDGSDEDDEFCDEDDAECDDVGDHVPWEDDEDVEWNDKSK